VPLFAIREYAVRRASCEQAAAFFAKRDPRVSTLRDVSLDQLEAHSGELIAETASRARFIIAENQRVLAMARALPDGDSTAIRSLTAASFSGARNQYEIVTAEMDMMMHAMLAAPGVIGARQAGAGFGGCMLAFVESQKISPFANAVSEAYKRSSRIDAQVFPV
jgi:galactokinase